RGLERPCFEQKEQKGTADAVTSANVQDIEGDVLICNGDHPLLTEKDIIAFIREFRDEKLDLAIVSAELENPGSLGRIIRHHGNLKAIVEVSEASADTLKVKEINTGIYLMKAELLKDLLPKVKNNNSKGEYYLTDILEMALKNEDKVGIIKGSSNVAHGVNTQKELAHATKEIFLRKADELMEAGVIVIDPSTVYIEDGVKVGSGSVVYPNVFLRGKTTVGSFCVLESNVFLSEATVGDSVQIRAGTYIEKSQVDNKVTLGPYARLRPDTHIHEEAHIGNFVELKKTNFGKRSKAGHLAYLGDAEIGEDVNIGCGAITVNYSADKQKYKTIIGNRAFIGSDTSLIAPIIVGDDAITGAGSVITKPVPDKALAVARGKQRNIENYEPGKKSSTETEPGT
ncbi:MAG: bifunctional UDP-N-acetylglucosamine diphosphorylase/glucosamine-1-phosphate N-acetyltransferase GlmU, partial [Bdellovibrionota bacterium]